MKLVCRWVFITIGTLAGEAGRHGILEVLVLLKGTISWVLNSLLPLVLWPETLAGQESSGFLYFLEGL